MLSTMLFVTAFVTKKKNKKKFGPLPLFDLAYQHDLRRKRIIKIIRIFWKKKKPQFFMFS